MSNYYTAQTVEAFGMPYTEYRSQPEEIPEIITVEFYPKNHPLSEYTYPHPKFVFTEKVVIREQYEYCLENQINLAEELNSYPIKAMELVENKLSNGRLSSAPYWLYGIRCHSGTRELMWFSDDELLKRQNLLTETVF